MKRGLAALLTVFGASSGFGQGQPLPCENAYPVELPYRVSIVSLEGPNSLLSDGREYVHDRAACMNVTDDPRGFLHLAHPNGIYWSDCRITPNRQFTLDLSRPVPGGGGSDRGRIIDNRPHIQVFTRMDSLGKAAGFQGMAVGETTRAMHIAIAATGHQLRLYFNPAQSCPGWLTVAPGSTQGTVTRTSATHWEIDIPEGSVGRLIEGPHAGPRHDRGLYYFRARLTVEARSP